MKPIVFATSDKYAGMYQDDVHAARALRELGVEVQPAVWDDPHVDWSQFAAVVLRSTWDYHLKPGAFREWIARLEKDGVRVLNPPDILRWNMDKIYLSDLEAAGVRVTPSVWLPRGAKLQLNDLLEAKAWSEAVVKPSVSASAHRTRRVRQGDSAGAQEELEELLMAGGVIVQPFMHGIVDQGEWSFIFFNKRYSHSVLKRAKDRDFRVQWDFGGSEEARQAPQRLIKQAAEVLDAVEDDLLYARVDALEQDRELVLMELELIEPELFFRHSGAAAGAFATALIESLGK